MDPVVLSETKSELPALIQLPQDLPRLNNWLFETAHPYITGKVLELNSGSGEFSSHLALHKIKVHLSDAEKNNRDILRKRFEGIPAFRGVHNIDFLRPDFTRFYSSGLGVFDTLLALNVAEYGFLVNPALDNAKQLLRKGGYLILIAPAFTALYHDLEETLEVWHKYNRRPLKRFLGAGLKIRLVRYFNIRENILDPQHNRFGASVLVIARKSL
jgi:SAM-dependent methyltransferase